MHPVSKYVLFFVYVLITFFKCFSTLSNSNELSLAHGSALIEGAYPLGGFSRECVDKNLRNLAPRCNSKKDWRGIFFHENRTSRSGSAHRAADDVTGEIERETDAPISTTIKAKNICYSSFEPQSSIYLDFLYF